MRKLGLLLSSMLVLTGFLALNATSAPASAIDPLCDDGAGGVKPFGAYETDLKTQGATSYTPSHTAGQGYTCSGVRYDGTNDESLFRRLDVVMPPGATIENTLGAAQGRFVGKACVGVLSNQLGGQYLGRPGALGVGACPLLTTAKVSVDNQTPNRDCQAEPDLGYPVLVACFRGQGLLGHGWIWVTSDGGAPARYLLTIGEFYPLVGRAGLTRIEPFDGANPYNPPFLCGYMGAVGGETCGAAGNPPVFTTGDPTPAEEREFCASLGGYTSDGTGTYTLTATTREPATTDPVTTCMPWE